MNLEELRRLKNEGKIVVLTNDRGRRNSHRFAESFFETPRTIDEVKQVLGYKHNASAWCSLKKKENAGVLSCFIANGKRYYVLTRVFNSLSGAD